jgi:hypothetical protein
MSKRQRPRRPNTGNTPSLLGKDAASTKATSKTCEPARLTFPIVPLYPEMEVSEPAAQKQAPIFVHSSFRTGGTWLWGKIRRAPTTLAYYEIFHESRSKIDMKKTAIEDQWSAWDSKHPALAPYFLESLPLRNHDGGIQGYDDQMAYNYFIPRDGINGSLNGSEVLYIDRLVGNARANRKIPVLTDTRTLGRISAIAKAFPSRSIFLHRNLFHQWASYSGQAINGNLYFLRTVDKILKASRHDAFLCALDDWFSSREMSPYDERSFQVFLLLHLYLYAFAYQAANVVIDITRIASDAEVRRSIETEISEWINWPIDLSDAQPHFDMSVLDVHSRYATIDGVNQFTKLIAGLAPSPSSAAFVESMKEDALLEWERHEFFTKGLRSVLTIRLEDANKRSARIETASELIATERDGLRSQLAEATAAHELLERSVATITAERDSLNDKLVETSATQRRSEQAVTPITEGKRLAGPSG